MTLPEYNKTNQLVREIYSLTGSNNLSDIFCSVISAITDKNVSISISQLYERSSIQYNNTGKYSAIIRIKVEKNSQEKQVLWNILHEYGHFLSGPTNNPNITREIEAWNKAYCVLTNYGELISLEQSFFEYQVSCLRTYFKNNMIVNDLPCR